MCQLNGGLIDMDKMREIHKDELFCDSDDLECDGECIIYTPFDKEYPENGGDFTVCHGLRVRLTKGRT